MFQRGALEALVRRTMGPEFQWIDDFVGRLPHRAAPAGPGDDAALLGGACVTVDAVVENVHFTRGHFSLEDIGHKALAVNLSDLAAMGARPDWWLCALGLPPGFSIVELRALAKGMKPLAVKHGLSLIGGNVTSSPVLSVTVTMAGVVKKPLLRSGARAGDVVVVTGALGNAAAGLAALHVPGAELEVLRRAQKRPSPMIDAGLAAVGLASAGIDVSDGLLQDLEHVAATSGVGVELDSSRLPISAAARRFGGERAVEWALSGGEDYVLALAVPKKKLAALLRKPALRSAVVIGEFTRARGVRVDGKPWTAKRGFSHR